MKNRKYLSNAEIAKVCPYAMMESPSNPNLSDQYIFLSTKQIIDDLNELGWFVVKASQRVRKSKEGEETKFSKHMVVFENPSITVEGANPSDVLFPQLIIFNSHDGHSSLQARGGIYRMICENGMVVPENEILSKKLLHKGYSKEQLKELIEVFIKTLPEQIGQINDMTKKELTLEEKQDLALKALLVRAGIDPASEKGEAAAQSKTYNNSDTLLEIITPERKEDQRDDLWTVFNVIQEHIVNGGFKAALGGEKVRKVRPIKSFEKDFSVNEKLFDLAVDMLD